MTRYVDRLSAARIARISVQFFDNPIIDPGDHALISAAIIDNMVPLIETVEAIGIVEASRVSPQDDFWGNEESCIVLNTMFTADALQGITDFSHAEVLYLFHEVERARVVVGTRHPRNNMNWPAVGIFAQRAKNRPNRIGSTICRILRVEDTRLFVSELDAINGTPVLDIKPVMIEFLPREPVQQPGWSHELMREYWSMKP